MVTIAKLWVLLPVLLLAGCAAKQDYNYVRPTTPTAPSNWKVIEKLRDTVWNGTVPALGRQSFVINNMGKASGLINLTYTGDPKRYIDCGQVSAYATNAGEERTYEFPGAAPSKTYELRLPQGLFRVDRKMALEARMNLVFEELTPTSTRVTATTRYMVTRTMHVTDANNKSNTYTDTISFSSGAGASFPAHKDGRATECVPTGLFETEVLSLTN
jgi:hypothetical protein